jgi:hypothetical protein
MQITNYGKRFIQYIAHGYSNYTQLSTKMMQKIHLAQNKATTFQNRTISVQQNKNKKS